jgi:hypothetical protein
MSPVKRIDIIYPSGESKAKAPRLGGSTSAGTTSMEVLELYVITYFRKRSRLHGKVRCLGTFIFEYAPS